MDASERNVLEPKTNRSPEEVGREIFRLVKQHDSIRVTQGENEWDIEIYIDE